MDRLSALDTTFLHGEDADRGAHMHIGSVSIFEGPTPPQEQIRNTILDRLHLVPKYRQRVQSVPWHIGRPMWVDAADFDIDYHLRRTAIASPGDEPELRALAGRLFSQRLDRTKPLWEVWVVEGLPRKRWALISKVHHCLVDGVSGVELMSTLLDLTPITATFERQQWEPHEVTETELSVAALRSLAADSADRVQQTVHALTRPTEFWRDVRSKVSGARSIGKASALRRSATLTGPIGTHRVLAWSAVPLADIKAARSLAPGATINDVVLAAVANGFRELLVARGEPVDTSIRTLVPVSVRSTNSEGAASGDGSFDNKVSAMFATLPIDIADPIERLEHVRDELSSLKESNQATTAQALTELSSDMPTALLALGARVAARASASANAPTPFETVTTNIPGPQIPLYCAGRRMLRTYPFVPVAAPVRISVGIFSYDGEVTFTVIGDRDTAADVEIIATGTTEAVAQFTELAETLSN